MGRNDAFIDRIIKHTKYKTPKQQIIWAILSGFHPHHRIGKHEKVFFFFFVAQVHASISNQIHMQFGTAVDM